MMTRYYLNPKMMARITNHKLLVDPTTFKWKLIEISYPPYEKRVVDPAELKEWERYRFEQQMKACGYGGFVAGYIEQEQIEFSDG